MASKKQRTEGTEDDVAMQEEINDFRVNTTFATVSFTIPASTDFLTGTIEYLHILFDNLIQADETVLWLPYDPKYDLTDTALIRQADKIPDKMTALQKYFKITSRAPKKDEKAVVWGNIRISHDSEFEDIQNLISYELNSNDINLMYKRVQCHTTENPGYLQFVCNQSDTDDIYAQIVRDIGEDKLWTIYNRIPWEGFSKARSPKKGSRDTYKDTFKKVLTIECKKEDSSSLVASIRKWIADGIAAQRFGPHIKFVESITNKTPALQIERTIRMNSHGRRFQASVGLMELCGLSNPDGIIPVRKGKDITVRELILLQTREGNPMFLSVTRKWQSTAWHAIYTKQYTKVCAEFCECPAPWLAHKLTQVQNRELYKHFTPEAVEEALASEWDNKLKRVITPKEKKAIEEEKSIAAIPWMIDLTALDNSLDENTSVTFRDGVNFDFNDEISVKTTRVTDKEGTSSKHRPNSPKNTKSILRSPSGDRSVTSEVTTETRLDDLESTVCELRSTSQQILALLQKNTNVAPASSQQATTGSGDNA